MSEYDFSGLTRAQQWLLTFQGWEISSEAAQPSPRTVAKLIKRGLVVPVEVKEMTRIGPMTVTEYRVPLDVHMAWCEHCSRQEALRAKRGNGQGQLHA